MHRTERRMVIDTSRERKATFPLLVSCLLFTLCFLVWSQPLSAATVTEKVLAEGTKNETAYYVIESGVSGPVVLITAGVHGSEKAPIRAAEQIRKWTIKKGTLIVLPRSNIRACTNGTREGGGFDLNRAFPSSSGESAGNALATAILKMIKAEKVDWLMDLHEGLDYSTNSDSVGQSVIYMPGKTETFASRLQAKLNQSISSKTEKFQLLKYPTKGSLARAAAEVHNVKSLIFETCRQDSLSTRIEWHRDAAVELLKYLGMK